MYLTFHWMTHTLQRIYLIHNKDFNGKQVQKYIRMGITIFKVSFGRYIVGYNVTNQVLPLHSCAAVKLNFQSYIQQYTSPNEHLENSYSATCFKQPLKRSPQIDFKDQLSHNAGRKYCRMLPLEHSAILSTCIMLQYHLSLRPLFCLFFEWLLQTGFTIFPNKMATIPWKVNPSHSKPSG